jgi:hypothetical protein
MKQPSKLNPEYSGKLSEYQLKGNTHNENKYNLMTPSQLNNYQIFLYNRALFGLSVYSPEEIKSMNWEKRKRIEKKHRKTRATLNIWKQQMVNKFSTSFFKQIFPDMEITKYLEQTTDDTDVNYVSNISFKTLGITKKDIVKKLIIEDILPTNFYELKTT